MAILNFYGYIVIEIEFLDPENLLLDIFRYFLGQLQTEISKFIEFWAAIFNFGRHLVPFVRPTWPPF